MTWTVNGQVAHKCVIVLQNCEHLCKTLCFSFVEFSEVFGTWRWCQCLIPVLFVYGIVKMLVLWVLLRWVNIVILATRLWAGWFRVWISAGADARHLSLVQMSRVALVPSCLIEWVLGLLPGVNWLGWDLCDHSYPSSTKVKNELSYTFAPHLCLRGEDRHSFTFTQKVFAGKWTSTELPKYFTTRDFHFSSCYYLNYFLLDLKYCFGVCWICMENNSILHNGMEIYEVK